MGLAAVEGAWFRGHSHQVLGVEIKVLVQRAVLVLVAEGLTPARVDLNLGQAGSVAQVHSDS